MGEKGRVGSWFEARDGLNMCMNDPTCTRERENALEKNTHDIPFTL